MKKILLFTAIILTVSSALAADPTSTTSSMQLSAYKDEVVDAAVSSAFTIKYFDETEIAGIVSSKDISSEVSEQDLSLERAFSIAISSNSRNTMTIDLEFSPFVNQSDPSDSDKNIPISYNIAATTSRQRGSNTVRSNNSNYYYAYLPSLTPSEESPVSVPKEGNTVRITYNPTYKTYRHTNRNTVLTTNTEYTGSLPNTSGNLPGFSDSDRLTSSVAFNLNLSSENYAAMLYFVEYIATVGISITMN